MHRALAGRCLNRALRIAEASHPPGVLAFLCPAAGRYSTSRSPRTPSPTTFRQCRLNHTQAVGTASEPHASTPTESVELPHRKLPLTCSGCGAFSQTSDPKGFGYFNEESKRVRQWMRPTRREATPEQLEEDDLVGNVLKSVDASQLEALGISTDTMIASEAPDTTHLEKPPICERCHDLLYYNASGESASIQMHHPTVESLRDTIEESPHKYNHIYHVIDAADFPMSLIPRLNVLLGDIDLRSKNRRSRSAKYHHDRKTEMSFIITRSDLLAPTKEMVDSMMPYLREVLRDALGRLGDRVRLGSLKCVSAKRAWWTKELKEDIWNRGGGGWMVGKVNVGKSQLFEAVFPKGRVSEPAETTSVSLFPREAAAPESVTAKNEEDWKPEDLGDLLPPPQPATDYPMMPVVSSLPGTTASPIRIPFGRGKGELIDLPGLARSDLDLFVKEEHRQSLIMKKRIVPEQASVKSGRSLLLGGGLIRLTPRTSDLVFLMYNFTPLKEHITINEKAVAFQEQTRESPGVENITIPGAGEKMRLAGSFQLSHDVTRERAGPLTRKNAVGLKVEKLPFRVLSIDILIEGVGYVEVVAQVRKRSLERAEQNVRGDGLLPNGADIFGDEPRDPGEPSWPVVDVFAPEGRFIGARKPIHGWLNNKKRVLAIHKKSRPRKSMRGQKKMAKQERRAAAS
ncbi:hypothetical protein B0I35DRAFT_408134 [Stachybotrys elegans]|uniref:G domain-containing protein n=1 Tax=Stachybotrys elegans TaxID=80388 RepID=A0A8K0WU09_9HYPO|nr:hypothetical protein B0I35DRAFT_408134 [Stachybotrys elegans]